MYHWVGRQLLQTIGDKLTVRKAVNPTHSTVTFLHDGHTMVPSVTQTMSWTPPWRALEQSSLPMLRECSLQSPLNQSPRCILIRWDDHLLSNVENKHGGTISTTTLMVSERYEGTLKSTTKEHSANVKSGRHERHRTARRCFVHINKFSALCD